MTIVEFLDHATATLKKAGITTARLDCLVLLEDVLGKDRALLLAHPEIVLSPADIALLNTYIVQREKHIPLAYIRGQAPFYRRTFTVNTHVLVPRPESEAMIDLLKSITFYTPPNVADIGTGSGCLGITAMLEVPTMQVWLADIDSQAIAVATANAGRHNVAAKVLQGDMLAAFSETNLDVILANLPYVPTDYPINDAAKHEPEIALFAGPDGMNDYRVFWKQLSGFQKKPQHVITESLDEQHSLNTKLAESAGYSESQALGLAQHFRRS